MVDRGRMGLELRTNQMVFPMGEKVGQILNCIHVVSEINIIEMSQSFKFKESVLFLPTN